MKGGIPAQVVRLDLVRRRDVVDRLLDQSLPVFRAVVAKPLRVLTAQRHHRRPHISGVLRHLPYRLREILHFAVRIPQSVFAAFLHAWTMRDVVDKILFLVHRLSVVLPRLLNKSGGVALCRTLTVVFVLNEFAARRKRFEQACNEVLLLFRRRKLTFLIRQQLHAGTGSDIASTLGQLRGVLSALEVGGNQYDPGHSSSGSIRRC